MTDNENEDEKRDDVDWLRDAFDRAIQGDNGTVPDATRPAVNPFAGLTPATEEPAAPVEPADEKPVAPTVTPVPVADEGHRHDLDLDFETDNMPPVTSFEPVVPLDRPLPSVATDYPPTEALDAVDLPTSVLPEPIVQGQPVAPEAPSAMTPAQPLSEETSGIDRLDALFASTDTSAATVPIASVPTAPTAEAPRRSGRGAPKAPRETSPDDQARFRQRLLLIVGGIVVAIVAIGAWVAGSVVSTPHAAPVPTATATPEAPTATQPPGKYAFTELFGGECVDPFDNAWAATFTVVDCATPHAAQLVYAGDLAADGAYLSYPGDDRVGKAALSACNRRGVLNLNLAKAYTDLQLSAAYPVNSEAWDGGDTRYYCFATLASASPIEGDLAGKLIKGATPTPEATASN